MMKSTIGWNFPENNHGQETGISDAGIETFSDNRLSSLAREIIQNSGDAHLSQCKKPVQVAFELLDVPRALIPGIDEIAQIHQRAQKYWDSNRKTTEFFKRSLSLLAQDRIPVLKISDYNTTGLSGSNKKHGSDWFNLIKSVGVSDKSPSEGGSFGIGKHAPFACSALRMVFYQTMDLDGNWAYQGVSKLVTHPNKENNPTQGTGYYGVVRDNSPITQGEPLFGQEPRTDPGTDVYVVGFNGPSNWMEETVRAVIENFFMAIHHERLVVNVNERLITATSLPKLIDQYSKCDESWNAAAYYQSIVSEESFHFEEPDFESLGSLELHLLARAGMPKRIAMTRETGMLIYEKGHFRTPVSFCGVLVARGEKLNELLRALEPPSHNDWVPGRHDNPKYAEGIMRKLIAWLHSKVRELTNDELGDRLDADGISQFLPDDLDEQEKRREEGAAESIENEKPSETTVRIRPIKPPGQRDIFGEAVAAGQGDDETSDVGEEGLGDGDPSSPNSGSGGATSAGGGSESEPGEGDATAVVGKGSQRGSSRQPVEIKDVRAFCSDPASSKYNLSFSPSKTGAGAVELLIVGEVGADRALIRAARRVDSAAPLPVDSNGRIGPIEFVADEKVALIVELEDAGRRALEVLAYADKV